MKRLGIPVIGLLDVVQEADTGDAPALPNAGWLTKVQAPPFLHALGLDNAHALRLTADLRGIESFPHILNQPCLVDMCLIGVVTLEDLGS